jgi:LruC domain-containing protein
LNRPAEAIGVLLIGLIGLTPGLALAVESTKLKDVIPSTGTGNIDLFRAAVQSRNLSSADLEAFRTDNAGMLAFAVDVNEAASGFEKSASQGVAVDSAVLTFIVDGVTHTFEEFSTETKSMIARAGETSRSSYFTLIGDGGSGRITSSTSSDIYGSSFDATLRMPVDIDISQATTAQLMVKLLDTNKALGDPEDFYDYSNGFEDVAIVTSGDAAYLDEIAPGRDEAPLVVVVDADPDAPTGTVFFPSENEFYIAAYEDQFPNRGDYDFNDLVVGYRVYTELDDSGRIVGVGAEGYLVARGGGFDHDWHLRIGLPGYASGSGTLTVYLPDQLDPMPGYPEPVNFVGALDVMPFSRTRNLWIDGSEAFVNTLRDQSLITGHRFELQISLDGSLMGAEMPAPPYDPYLFVYNTDYEIHLPGKAPVRGDSSNQNDGLTQFTDGSGYPFAMILPEDWLVPIEFIDLGEAYPDFLDFVISDRTTNTDWYQRPGNNKTKPVDPALWKW